MICEMCGVEVPRTRRVLIEGTPLSVCSNCAKFGSPVPKKEEERGAPIVKGLEMRRYRPRDVYEKDVDVLVNDYPARIREAREGMGISQEDLGKRLNEKLSVINKLETGDMRPDDKLVAKLERTLGIKLRERFTPSKVEKKTVGQALTIGDLIREAKE
ncbi:MAG: TIGR00270 family protein [Thermoplasmata archaeon]|nr:TIGR00270 family protein [Thermoplasmata archaeon]